MLQAKTWEAPEEEGRERTSNLAFLFSGLALEDKDSPLSMELETRRGTYQAQDLLQILIIQDLPMSA